MVLFLSIFLFSLIFFSLIIFLIREKPFECRPDDSIPIKDSFGDNDDYVDSTTQALMKYRQGYHVMLKDDYEDEKSTTIGTGREYY